MIHLFILYLNEFSIYLIFFYIESLNQDTNAIAYFESFMNSKKKEELDKIITNEGLKKKKHIILFKEYLIRKE